MTDSTRVGFSNRLDLDRFFFEAKGLVYAVVKLDDDFPNYYRGSDIDVFCYDKDAFARSILNVGIAYLDEGFEIVVTDKNESHTHVDFRLDGQTDLRFDLYRSLPDYKNIRLKEHYIYSVIENAETRYREFGGTEYPLYVPSTVDDLLLRYVEYIEWYETRPDKVKHLDHILQAVSDDHARIGFLDKLHLYTRLPSPSYDEGDVSAFGRRCVWLRRIREIPPGRIPAALLRILRRIALALLRKVGGVPRSQRRDHSQG